MEYSAECNVNDWHEASRAVLQTYFETVGKDWGDNPENFDTPTQFTLLMQCMCMFHAGQNIEIEVLRKEVDELTEENKRLRYGN